MQLVKINESLPTPAPRTPSSGGIDLHANIEEEITLQPGESCMISTGVRVAIPEGYVGMLFPRSGKGSSGMQLKNTVGIIDADYRGEVFANVRNYETDSLRIAPAERFVQLVIVSIMTPRILVVDELEATVRGEGGFGSTGTH